MDLDTDGESDDEGLNIVGHVVDEQFTYENVGEVASRVESEVSPRNALERGLQLHLFLDEELPTEDTIRSVGMVHWGGAPLLKVTTLIRYAIFKNDLPLLDWLLKAGHECASNDPSDKTAFTLGQGELQLAMILGHTECLGMLIQSTAVGLPLLKLSKDSGTAAKEEPEYYQGLSIRGQKRKDWADAGRPDNNNFGQGSDAGRSPVLISALQGSMASTEWFLGTAPSRYYLEYVNSHLEDENVQRVSQSELGLEASVLNWLQARSKFSNSRTMKPVTDLEYRQPCAALRRDVSPLRGIRATGSVFGRSSPRMPRSQVIRGTHSSRAGDLPPPIELRAHLDQSRSQPGHSRYQRV
jgi:hypothetical protein